MGEVPFFALCAAAVDKAPEFRYNIGITGGDSMFYINKMGCSCTHDKSFIFDRPKGYEGYLMLFVKSKAEFLINETIHHFEPNTFIIYDRCSPNHYKACGEDYVNDWIQFETTENLEAAVGVRFDEPVYIGDSIDVSQYFHLLSDCFYRTGNMKAAGYIIKAMLGEVFFEGSKKEQSIAHHRELIDLRRRIYSSPERDWSIGSMASLLNISEPYLHLLYKKAFGVTCTRDVINSRIELAQRYLSYSGMTVEEVAFACGYKNVVHFSRQFKQISGESPSEWRKAQ